MSNQLDSNGMPCVEEGSNQIDGNGMPSERYLTKVVDKDMNKMM